MNFSLGLLEPCFVSLYCVLPRDMDKRGAQVIVDIRDVVYIEFGAEGQA
jgi:hypothetical protein